MLDYYLVGDDGILVEEFVFDESCTPLGLDSAYRTIPLPGTPGPVFPNRPAPPPLTSIGAAPIWTDGSMVSRQLRADAKTRATVRPVTRAEAASRGVLADEPTLRGYFTSRLTLHGAPLSFGTEQICRILLTGPADPILSPGSDGSVRWELRNIGPGVAWAVDVYGPAMPALLHQLKGLMRQQGFFPVTIERLG